MQSERDSKKTRKEGGGKKKGAERNSDHPGSNTIGLQIPESLTRGRRKEMKKQSFLVLLVIGMVIVLGSASATLAAILSVGTIIYGDIKTHHSAQHTF